MVRIIGREISMENGAFSDFGMENGAFSDFRMNKR